MKLAEQINQDFLTAYKSHDEAKSSLLKLLKSSLQNAQIAKQGELQDEEVIKLIQKEVKLRQEAIVQYKKGGRDDLAAKDEAEIVILKTYLPSELSDEELEKLVAEVISSVGGQSQADFGRVMGAVMPKIAGRATGNVVSSTVKKLLS